MLTVKCKGAGCEKQIVRKYTEKMWWHENEIEIWIREL